MPRNLDLTALRSFVAVADSGGVTRAAGFLNLTQSAVSMQLKRLEDGLGVALIDRGGRGMAPTAAGDQLLGYARRMLALNDEVYARLTEQTYEGEIRLGVPADIVFRAIPQVLQQFHAEFPRVKVQLLSSYTTNLKAQFERGEIDMILTTETATGAGGETLIDLPLVWVGAPGGKVWRRRPLRLAFEPRCLFRTPTLRALDAAGIDWEMAVESESTRTIEASVSADLAVNIYMDGMEPGFLEQVAHGGALPEIDRVAIGFYVAEMANGPVHRALADLVRQAYRGLSPASSRRPSRSSAATA